jgi:DNA-directed RNA polymerase specialized sigma24 family protein
LYDRAAAVAYGLALRITGDPHRAEAILVAAFTAAAGWPDDLGGCSAFDRLVQDVRARALAHRRVSDGPGPPDAGGATVVGFCRDPHAIAAVRGALAGLDAMDREILDRAYFEGQSAAALAARFGVGEPEVRRRLRAALVRVAAARTRSEVKP